MNSIIPQPPQTSKLTPFKDAYVGDMPFQVHLQKGSRVPLSTEVSFFLLIKGMTDDKGLESLHSVINFVVVVDDDDDDIREK